MFDGEVPDSAPEPMPPQGPTMTLEIPDPIPEGAFGHIKPDDWLPSISTPVHNSEHGSEYIVTANVTDVPLEILPGRSKEFSNFVSKVSLFVLLTLPNMLKTNITAGIRVKWSDRRDFRKCRSRHRYTRHR